MLQDADVSRAVEATSAMTPSRTEPLHGYPIFCITAVKYDSKGVPQKVCFFTGRGITLQGWQTRWRL